MYRERSDKGRSKPASPIRPESRLAVGPQGHLRPLNSDHDTAHDRVILCGVRFRVAALRAILLCLVYATGRGLDPYSPAVAQRRGRGRQRF